MGQLPRIVYVPAHPSVRDGRQVIVYETRRMSDGALGLPAYSSVERLVSALGSMQPWVALPLDSARTLMGAAGVTTVVIDAGVAADDWRWSAEDFADVAAASQ